MKKKKSKIWTIAALTAMGLAACGKAKEQAKPPAPPAPQASGAASGDPFVGYVQNLKTDVDMARTAADKANAKNEQNQKEMKDAFQGTGE